MLHLHQAPCQPGPLAMALICNHFHMLSHVIFANCDGAGTHRLTAPPFFVVGARSLDPRQAPQHRESIVPPAPGYEHWAT